MKKNINEAKIAADAAKRFRMLCEYSFNITEDDEEQEEIPQDMPAEGGYMGGEMPQDGGEMPQGDDMNQRQPPMPEQGGDMGGEIPQDGGAPGFNPQEDMPAEGGDIPTEGGDMLETEPMQADDEVIDIDELVNSQEETEEKIEDVEVSMKKGFHKLLDVVNKLDQMIDNSTANMEQIKQEIEKRNPTPLEKLNMRAANDSYPFNVSPDDYWKEKEATSNYRIGGENEEDAPQYTIKQSDIDKITDFSQISKDLDGASFNQNLLNIFGLK